MDTLNGIIVFHNQQVEPRSHNLQQSSGGWTQFLWWAIVEIIVLT